MYRLQTRSDFLFMALLSSVVLAMGVLLLALPPRSVPTEPAAYLAISGRLSTIVDRGGRRVPGIVFTLDGDGRRFESDSIGYRDVAERWQPGRTRLDFLVERDGPQLGDVRAPISVFGLVADGVAHRTLAADIEARNARADSWAGLLAVAIGTGGLLVAALAWRRRPPV